MGLSSPVEIARDDRGVPTIRAKSLNDAYFAIGFAHAQDRLFQMELMRRVGAGRLAETVGAAGVSTDKLMRTLGLYRMAEAEAASASPSLKAALDAYAAGVNAFLKQRRGALPLEFQLLRITPEPWKPADSLVWGRIMALQLSANWHEERLNLALKKALAPDLFQLLLPEIKSLAGLPTPWFGRLNVASNNWVIGPQKSESGAALLANDPHLSLGAPAIWYLVHIETSDRQWVGGTSPGMPMIVIGASDRVAWGLTTTSGDNEDLFEEKPIDGNPQLYQTPEGSAPFETRQEAIKVKGGANVVFEVRSTRHGPVVSDLDEDRKDKDPVMALAATFLLPDDRTADALFGMNMARSADEFRTALADFHAPQQNIVFADREGRIGFVAAGRVPVRGKLFASGLLPAPGWTGEYDWTGTLPFDQLPQSSNPRRRMDRHGEQQDHRRQLSALHRRALVRRRTLSPHRRDVAGEIKLRHRGCREDADGHALDTIAQPGPGLASAGTRRRSGHHRNAAALGRPCESRSCGAFDRNALGLTDGGAAAAQEARRGL